MSAFPALETFSTLVGILTFRIYYNRKKLRQKELFTVDKTPLLQIVQEFVERFCFAKKIFAAIMAVLEPVQRRRRRNSRPKTIFKGGFHMLQFIMERNVLLYVLAAACAVGVVSQLILKQIYERLIRNTQNTGEAEGKFLQQLRQRFQYCTHLNEKVGNVQALIRKSLMEYRFWGMGLRQWKRMGGWCLAVSLICAFAGSLELIRSGQNVVTGNTYFWMGALAVVLTAAAYGISDTGYKREALEVGLADYLQNSGAVRGLHEQAEGEAYGDFEEQADVAAPTPIVSVREGRKAKRRARAETAAAQAVAESRTQAQMAAENRAQREKRELKETLARAKTGMQETAAERDKESRAELLRQMDPKEQERILREVLKEFLS